VKFIAVHCSAHGYLLLDAPVQRHENHSIECPGGHLLIADTRDLTELETSAFITMTRGLSAQELRALFPKGAPP